MNDEINQLDSIIDGTGTADDATAGDTIDTVAHLGDGTFTGETYNVWSTTIGYNLLGTTGGTPNLDQFNRVQNMFWQNYGTDTTLDGFKYLRSTQGDVTQRINAVDAVFSEMYANDKLDQVESLNCAARFPTARSQLRHSQSPSRRTVLATSPATNKPLMAARPSIKRPPSGRRIRSRTSPATAGLLRASTRPETPPRLRIRSLRRPA